MTGLESEQQPKIVYSTQNREAPKDCMNLCKELNPNTLRIPWNEIVSELQQSRLLFLEKPTDEELAKLYLAIPLWESSFYWFVKLEILGKKYKHPCPKKIRVFTENRGSFLCSLFKLCKHCHALQNVFRIHVPYSDAALWLGVIFQELISLELWDMVHILPNSKVYYSSKKEAELEVHRNRLRLLKKGKNPFEETPSTPGLSLLMKAGLRLRMQQNTKFNKEYWQPFLTSYSRFIAEMKKSEYRAIIVSNAKVYLRGKGKQKILICSLESLAKKFDFQTLTG